jgi:hypothetical protein
VLHGAEFLHYRCLLPIALMLIQYSILVRTCAAHAFVDASLRYR